MRGFLVGIPVTAVLFDEVVEGVFSVAYTDEDPLVGVTGYARVPLHLFNDDLGSPVAFLFKLVISVTYADQLVAVFLKQGPGTVNAG